MQALEQRRIIEALILASAEPITLVRLVQIVPSCSAGEAKDRINELNTEYQEQDRSFEIWEVAGGYQIRTRAEFSGYLQQLRKERPLRLSRAALETLAIVAYKQPVTRAELEAVRGVDTGAVIRSLLDRRLVRIAGHREVPGRPILYASSRRFLEVFGLESLDQLPTLRELEELARDHGVELPGHMVEDGPTPAVAVAAEPSESGEQDGTTDLSEQADAPEATRPPEALPEDAAAPQFDDETDESPRPERLGEEP